MGCVTVDPPFPGPVSPGSATPLVSAADDRGFYRSPARVAVLAFLAPVSYELWWFWQLFKFTRREAFPRMRAFWWILVPIYGWVVIYRQFDDLKQQLAQLPTPVAYNSAGAGWLVVISNWAASGPSRAGGVASLVALVVSGLLIALAMFITQRAANAYQRARYPGRIPRGMSPGEVIATVIGLLLFALVIADFLLPS